MNRLQRRRQAARLRRCDDTTTVPLCPCCGEPLEGEAAHRETQRALAYRDANPKAPARNCTLADAAASRAQHPRAPGAAAPPPDIAHLGPGWLAKVAAKFVSRRGPGATERFWVQIDAADSSGRFRGKIINELNFRGDHGLDEGDLIEFERGHVLDVAPPRLMCQPAAGSA